MSDLINRPVQSKNEQMFNFNGTPLTTIKTEDNKIWFIGKEAATILGYKNTNDAIIKHCKGGREMRGLMESGQSCIIIPEADLYRLIFKSKLPEAERFEKWVTEEVLPSIRKNGNYVSIPQTLPEALELAAKFARENVSLLEKIQDKNEEIEVLTPLAETTIELIGEDDEYSMDNLARLLKIVDIDGKKVGRTKLFNILRARRILMKDTRHNQPFILYEKKGWFTSKLCKQKQALSHICTTKVTTLGIHEMRLLFKGWGYKTLN